MLPSAHRFAERNDPSSLAEWMDEPCSYEDFRDCLIDLAKANCLLFAHRPILHWLASQPRQNHPLHIVDVGSGGGDLLRAVADWAARKNIAVRLTGVDMNPMATRAAAEFSSQYPQIEWVTTEAQQLPNQENIDVVLTSLCTHHMADTDIVKLLQWMDNTAQIGWFISDLLRSRMNYILFTALSRTAGWHRFVQHDGPVSILRGFREDDWLSLCATAEITDIRVQRATPGRLCVSKTRG